MFGFIKRLFAKPQEKETKPFESPRMPGDPRLPDEVEANPMMREVMLRAIRSGNIVFGNIDESGKVTIEEVPD